MDAIQWVGTAIGAGANLVALVALVGARGRRGAEAERFAHWARYALLALGLGLVLGLAELVHLAHDLPSDTPESRASVWAVMIAGGMNCGAFFGLCAVFPAIAALVLRSRARGR